MCACWCEIVCMYVYMHVCVHMKVRVCNNNDSNKLSDNVLILKSPQLFLKMILWVCAKRAVLPLFLKSNLEILY